MEKKIKEFKRKLIQLDEAKPKQEWFAVPPYKNEGWQILNSKGEFVAAFEAKEECLKTVERYNNEHNG